MFSFVLSLGAVSLARRRKWPYAITHDMADGNCVHIADFNTCVSTRVRAFRGGKIVREQG